MNNCIKCDKLSNEKKILINIIFKLKGASTKECADCLEWNLKERNELAQIIEEKDKIKKDERTKNYILAALKEYPFEDCEIESHENIPLNEIGPMKGLVIDIYLSEPIGNFILFHNHVKDNYQDKYKKIVDMKCFKENENMIIEFPIVLVTPPDRGGIKYLSNGVKYYVEDGNHRLLKWIDSGIKEGKPVETVPAFVIIDPEYAP